MLSMKTAQQVIVLLLMGVVNVTAAMCVVHHTQSGFVVGPESDIKSALMTTTTTTPVAATVTDSEDGTGKQVIEVEHVEVVWDTASLRMYCLIGASLGGVLAVSLMPDKRSKECVQDADSIFNNPARKMALKFFCSAICGVLATPLILRKYAMPLDSDYVMCVSGFVSAASIGLIWIFMPFAEAYARRKAKRLFGESDSSIVSNRSNKSKKGPQPGRDSIHNTDESEL